MARQQDLLSQLEQITRSLNRARDLISAEAPSREHIHALRELDRADLALRDSIDQMRRKLDLPPSRPVVSNQRPRQPAPQMPNAAKTKQRPTPAPPLSQAGRRPKPAMVQCPHCEAMVKPQNLDRHIQKMHAAFATTRAPVAPLAPPPHRSPTSSAKPPARGSSPGLALPGPTHHARPQQEQQQTRMEELAASETLRKITLELELLNRDLYRED